MTTYQKIAALVFRITAVGLILHSIVMGVFYAVMMAALMLLTTLPYLLAGVALFVWAIPLSKLVTMGFKD